MLLSFKFLKHQFFGGKMFARLPLYSCDEGNCKAPVFRSLQIAKVLIEVQFNRLYLSPHLKMTQTVKVETCNSS